MKKKSGVFFVSVLMLVAVMLAQLAVAQTQAGQRWLTTWGASMQQPPANAAAYSNQTLRMFVRVSVGGQRARVQLSNTFATTPLVLGPVHVAFHGQGSAVVPGSDRTLLFSGKPTVKIAPGALAVSDPVNLDIP